MRGIQKIVYFCGMQQLICQQELELQFLPGKSSWSYFLQLPHTKDIKGKWGEIKVTGTIDSYNIELMNLAPLKGQDKILSVNAAMRKALGKTAGDRVMVTLYLVDYEERVQEQHILDSFRDADVYTQFQLLGAAQSPRLHLAGVFWLK